MAFFSEDVFFTIKVYQENVNLINIYQRQNNLQFSKNIIFSLKLLQFMIYFVQIFESKT